MVRIFEGLGNQMFQYAMARALSHRLGRPLMIDDSLLQETRSIGLRAFELSASSLNWSRIARASWLLACPSRRGYLCILGAPIRSFQGIKLITERAKHEVDPVISTIPRNQTVCLSGYWQCPKYFIDFEALIRREFAFRQVRNNPITGQSRSSGAGVPVSLHIRRGDYLTVSGAPVLSKQYYDRAVEVVASHVANPEFFIFSDDIPWARENIQLSFKTTYVEGYSSHQDLQFMASCRHHIIANSTFSWWAAWLNPFREKLVIAPKYWMCRFDTNFPELFPPEWIAVDNLS
jgi:hypothetical protein